MVKTDLDGFSVRAFLNDSGYQVSDFKNHNVPKLSVLLIYFENLVAPESHRIKTSRLKVMNIERV